MWDNGDGFAGLDDIIKSKIIMDGSGSFQCCECNYASTNSRNVINHIESKHVTTTGVQCDVCQKICPTREALRKHISRLHRQ